MNDLARLNVCALIKAHGRELLDDPPRLVQLLRQYCGDRSPEFWSLTASFELHIPQEIAQWDGTAHWGTFFVSLVKRLESTKGLPAGDAAWAVETWAAALGARWGDDFAVETMSAPSLPDLPNTPPDSSSDSDWLPPPLPPVPPVPPVPRREPRGRAVAPALCLVSGGVAVGALWLIFGTYPGRNANAEKPRSPAVPAWPDLRETVKKLTAERAQEQEQQKEVKKKLDEAAAKLTAAATTLAAATRRAEEAEKEARTHQAEADRLRDKWKAADRATDQARQLVAVERGKLDAAENARKRAESERQKAETQRQKALTAHRQAQARFESMRDVLRSYKAHVTIHNPTSTPSGIKLRWRYAEGEWGDPQRFDIPARGYRRFEQVGAIDLEIEFDRIAGNNRYDRWVQRWVGVDRYPAQQKLSAKHGRHHHFSIDRDNIVYLREGEPKQR